MVAWARDWALASTYSDGGVGGFIHNYELIYDGGKMASATLCRQGGDIQTSIGCSKLPGHEVMCSTWLGSGPRRQISAGRGLSSSWPLFLGGAWRTPARCGGGTWELDCFRSICSRVFSVKSRVLSSNSRFPRARDAKIFVEIVLCHIAMNGYYLGSSRPRPLFKKRTKLLLIIVNLKAVYFNVNLAQSVHNRSVFVICVCALRRCVLF
jgi:hypothetical protein